jgi:cytochrome P450
MISQPRDQPRSWCFGLDHLLRIRRNQLAFYEEQRSRYGDAVLLRLGPYRSWLLFHPDAIEALLTQHWSSFIRFRKLTEVVAQWNGENLLLVEGEEWRERRRKVLPAFQTRHLSGYGRTAVDHAARLTDQLARQADTKGHITFNTDGVMARVTLDIAIATLFGSEPPHNGDEVERALQVLSATAFHESTSPFTLPDWLPLPSKRRKRWAMTVMDRIVVDLVEKGLQRGLRDANDLLSMLIEQHDADATAIRNDSMGLLIAGHETSGALLSWLFACLARNRQWLGNAIAELERELGGRPPTVEDLPSLKVVSAVVEEALRLYPPAYSLFLRQAVCDVDVAGTIISKGDLVQIAPFTVHRDPRWFANPLDFDPSRFLEKTTWPRYAYLPFGAGPRVCIGQNLALVEACLVVATILQRCHPLPLDSMPEPDPKFSLRPKGGLPMTWLCVS